MSTKILPGLLLCAVVTAVACGLAQAETALFGRAWLESLVLAILLGTSLRTLTPLSARWDAGIHFSAKTLLELAVLLLGATVSASALLANGWMLLAGIAGVVMLTISCSYAIGRISGLSAKLALLIACGNSWPWALPCRTANAPTIAAPTAAGRRAASATSKPINTTVNAMPVSRPGSASPAMPLAMPASSMPMKVAGSHLALGWRTLHAPTATIASK